MRLAALLARKDLQLTARDRMSFIFDLVMPLVFTLFFGLLFGANSNTDKLPLAVWDADGGAAATQLMNALDHSKVVTVVPKEGRALEQWMADQRAAAGLIIPEGYSAAVAAGKPASLTVVATQGSSGASTAATEVRSLAGRQVAVELASRAAAQAVWATRAVRNGTREAAVAELAARAKPVVAQALDHPAVSTKVVEAGSAANQTPTGFVLSSPGMMVNFILFSLMTAGIALISERQDGTLQRLMTTRLRRSELIGGKVAGMFLITFLQQAILIGVAQVFFGVDYLRDPAALLLMMISLSLVASTLGLLLASVLKTEQALVATTVLTSMVVAALSGAWFPLEIAGQGFQTVGHLLPTAWILDGLRGIIVRGFDVAAVAPAFWYALAWAGGLFALAVWRFRLSE
ncbi:MAG TPA: ABC transporter permease [Thermoleophilia bacterium]|nr:ABC transporter permease [Thermoleophilia bacterium]